MTRNHQLFFALCSTRYDQVDIFPSYGRIEAREWDPDPQAPGGIRGLLWGKGDPASAGLDWDEWAVVRIDDANGPVAIQVTSDGVEAASVKFQFGTVIFKGDRRGAIETLIQNGADPNAIAVRLALPNEDGIADSGPYGVAVAGRGGLARGADYAQVVTGDGGLAVAGDFGAARAGDGSGIAAVGCRGLASAGDEGLAIARRWGASAKAGDGGIAVAIEESGSLTVGHGGLAIGLGGAKHIDGGRHSIAIVRHAVEGRTTVSLGETGIAILDFRSDGDAPPSFAVASFGPGGLEPHEAYVWSKGAFQKKNAYHEGRITHRDQDEALFAGKRAGVTEDPLGFGKPFQTVNLPLDRPLGADTLVLCNAFYDAENRCVRDRGEVSTSHWDPDPSSNQGLFGLAWGACNGELAARHLFGNEFSLVRVADPVFVPLSDPKESGDLVKFAGGEIVLCGSLGEAFAALAGMGADPGKFPGLIASAGDRGRVRVSEFGIARVGQKGFAVAGHQGDAQVGPDGVAIVTGQGIAQADAGGIAVAWGEGLAIAGKRGVAISDTKRHGRSEAGAEGVAIAMGTRMASAKAGWRGAAILQGCGGHAQAGDSGIVYGSSDSWISVGRNGIAVSENGRLEGGPGSLLVLVGPGGKFKTAVVDEAGDVPQDFSDWRDEVLLARNLVG